MAVKVLPAAYSADPDRLRCIELSGMESTAVSVAGVEGSGSSGFPRLSRQGDGPDHSIGVPVDTDVVAPKSKIAYGMSIKGSMG